MYAYKPYQTRTREENNSWEELAVLRRREQHGEGEAVKDDNSISSTQNNNPPDLSIDQYERHIESVSITNILSSDLETPPYGSDITIDTPLTEQQKERYNWDEALLIFKKENPRVGPENLNMWLRKNLKLGWRVGDIPVPNIRDIEITPVTHYWEQKPFEVWYIKAYSYNDAYSVVTDYAFKGLWYWITPIKETKSSLQRKGSISAYNRNHFGHFGKKEFDALLEKLYTVCKDKTAYDNAKESTYAGGTEFIVLVKAVQKKFWGDDKHRVTGMLTPLTLEKVNAEFESKIKATTTSYNDDKETLITKLLYVSGDLELYQAAIKEQIQNESQTGPQVKQYTAFRQLVRSAQEVLFDTPSEWTGEIEKNSKTYVAVDEWGKRFGGNVSAMDEERVRKLVQRRYDQYSMQRKYYEQAIKSKQVSINYYQEKSSNDPHIFKLLSEITELNVELDNYSWNGLMKLYGKKRILQDENKYISGYYPLEHDISEYPLKNPYGNSTHLDLGTYPTLNVRALVPNPDDLRRSNAFYEGFKNAPQTSLKQQISGLDQQSKTLRRLLSTDYQQLSASYENISNKSLSVSTAKPKENDLGKYYYPQQSSTITPEKYAPRINHENNDFLQKLELKEELRKLSESVAKKLDTLKETDPNYPFLKVFSSIIAQHIFTPDEKLKKLTLKSGGNYSIAELYRIAQQLVDIELAEKLLPKGNLVASNLKDIAGRQRYLEEKRRTVGADAVTIPTYLVLDEVEKDYRTYIHSPGYRVPTKKENTLLHDGIPLNVFLKQTNAGEYTMWIDLGSGSMREASVSASSNDEALAKLFDKLEGQNIFPDGKVYYIDSDKSIQQIKTSGDHWTWGQILSAISIGLMILAIPFTAGGSLGAAYVIGGLGIATGITGEVVDMYEKSEAGTLTGGDVALGGLSILAMALPGIGLLGSVSRTTRIGSKLAVLEGKTFKTITYTTGATDALVQSYILTDNFITQYNNLPEGLTPEEEYQAVMRLLMTSLALGLLTIHSFKTDVKGLNQNIRQQLDSKEGVFIKNIDDAYKFINDQPTLTGTPINIEQPPLKLTIGKNMNTSGTGASHLQVSYTPPQKMGNNSILQSEYSVTRNGKTIYYTKDEFIKKLNAGEFDAADVQQIIATTNDPKVKQALQEYVVRNETKGKKVDVKETDISKNHSNLDESSLNEVRGVTKSDFIATVGDFSDGANAKIADQAWELWKQQKWSELELFFNTNSINKYNGMVFPPNNGAINVVKKTLDPGDFYENLVIDRYGPTTGKFTAPANTPFPQRALPNSYESQTPQKYKVLKPIPNVEEGQIIPWFNQPGLGIQYKLEKPVQYYIDEGFLQIIP